MLVNPPPAVSGLTLDDRAELAATLSSTLLTSVGLPLKLAPRLVTGSSVEQAYALTLPDGITLTAGRKYRLDGILFVRDGSTVLSAGAYANHVLKRGSESWTDVRPGAEYPVLNGGASAFFDSVEDVFTLGEDSGVLSLVGKPIDGESVTIEFDGTIADLGTD
jgi:hypothetical protein